MIRIELPTNCTLHASQSFLQGIDYFGADDTAAELVFHPRWMHLEPYALAMLAAWGEWCNEKNLPITARNLGASADFAWRMRLFDHVKIPYSPQRAQHEEAGRFLPLTMVTSSADVRSVMADISALLHLDKDEDELTAVQFCVSELIRNAIEHSGNRKAIVCAHNYSAGKPKRITIAVADTGMGIRAHLGRARPIPNDSDAEAVLLSLYPGITGAIPGVYGTAENAGAGLFMTRSIAKSTGGYFLLLSGNACYRQMRIPDADRQTQLFPDPRHERHNVWKLQHPWQGTVVTMEIVTERIWDFREYLDWIKKVIPEKQSVRSRLRFE